VIEAFVHFTKLFTYFIEFFRNECQPEIEKRIKDFCTSDDLRNKSNLGDLGEFIIILMVSREKFWEDK